MGIISDIGKRIASLWKKDKDVLAAQLAQGSTHGTPPAMNQFSYGGGPVIDGGSPLFNVEHDLLARYTDYENMDDYPELSNVLDIFADDATQIESQKNRTLWVTAKDEGVEGALSDMLHKRLRVDDEIWEIARSMCKMGNEFDELLVTDEGVVGLNALPAQGMRRIEDCHGSLLGFVQTFSDRVGISVTDFENMLCEREDHIKKCDAGKVYSGAKDVPFDSWEVVHFRLRGKHRRSAYGWSAIDPARYLYRRLAMMEDAALVFQLQKAIERYAFYIDVGDLPPAEALAYVNNIRQKYKKKRWVNPQTGKLELAFNPGSPDEDFFVPSRAGKDATRIELIQGPVWQNTDTLEFFRDKMFGSIKVPKSYLGQEAEVARATLSSQDVRFARTILRVQRELKNGFGKICRVHLAALDLDSQRIEYELHMTIPSAIFELAQIEVHVARADLATRLIDIVSIPWLLTSVLKLSDEEAQKIISERQQDVFRAVTGQAQADAAAQKFLPPEPLESKQRPMDVLKERNNRRRGITKNVHPRLLEGASSRQEREWGEKLHVLLANDRHMVRRLRELRGLLEDMKYVRASKAA